MKKTTEEPGYLGFWIGARRGALVVANVAPDGPADEAGLLRGDRLVRIDGRDASNLDKKAAAALLRGDAGRTVTLEVTRGSEEQPFVLRMVSIPRPPRQPVLVPLLKSLARVLVPVLVIAGMIAWAISATAVHRRVTREYVAHLQRGDTEAAFALLLPERRETLSVESWRATLSTSSLLGSDDFRFGGVSGDGRGRGCVHASVATESGRFRFTVYTRVTDEGAFIHTVLGTVEQRGLFHQGPWECH